MIREELLKKLNYTKSCLSNQSQVPVLSHFCFDDTKIMTFNGAQGIMVDFNSGVKGCIPGDMLYKLISSYASPDIKMIPADKEVTVEASNSSMKLKTLPQADFPFKMPELKDIPSFEITQEFFQGISKCLFASGDDASELMQFGVTLVVTAERSALYATDKKRVSRFILSKALGITPFKLIMPKTFCELLVKVSSDFNSGTIYVGDTFIFLQCSGVGLYSKFVKNAPLFDFENHSFPYESNDKVKFQAVPDSFISCVERSLILLSGEMDLEICAEISGTILLLSTRNSFGEVNDQIIFKEDMGTLGFKCNPEFLKQALSSIDQIFFMRTIGSDGLSVVSISGRKDNFVHDLHSF
jgi:DNA polymerase III sliding clamp (beta) subunit (PCNA family)